MNLSFQLILDIAVALTSILGLMLAPKDAIISYWLTFAWIFLRAYFNWNDISHGISKYSEYSEDFIMHLETKLKEI